MAGYDNIKDKGFDHRSTGELREISVKLVKPLENPAAAKPTSGRH